MYFDSVIVAADLNWGIGLNNNLLFHIKKDMEHFKKITTGNIVVMGRKTFESLPVKPLPNRDNIVITSNREFKHKRCEIVHNDEELDKITEKLREKGKKVILIGGGTLYNKYIDYCKYAYVTRVNTKKEADTFFPNLDRKDNWLMLETKYDMTEDSKTLFAIHRYKNTLFEE